MLAYVVRRTLLAGLVALAAASLAFVLLRFAPGDPFSRTVEQPGIPEATRALWRAQLGLDRPLVEQYGRFLLNAARGELGHSVAQARPAAAVIADALPRTLLLMGTALLLAFGTGTALGVWQAVRRGGVGERLTSAAGLVLYSMPEFWLALVALVVLAIRLRWFPVGGVASATADLLPAGARLLDRLHHLVLPAVVLAAGHAAVIARFQRDALSEQLGAEHLRAARARGLGAGRVVLRHALRNALAPVIALGGLAIPALVGGAVLVERVFAWQGIGLTTLTAIAQRDYFVVTAAVLAGGVVTAVGTLLADLAHLLVDPRLREP